MQDQTTTNSVDENIKRLGKLIKDIKVAMLTSVDEKGRMHSRPMATQQIDFDGNLWFFTGENSQKVAELQRLQQVQISYAEPKDQRYLSVTGTAELVHDRKMAERLWNVFYKAWFPEGLDDPNLTLIKVNVEMAEYWESLSSPAVHLIGFTKAILTGKPYKGEGSEHGKVKLAG
ncbi:MAG: pyridoxamine 5'-phosphate oxidase family protein [Bdellovibrionia bacterium]